MGYEALQGLSPPCVLSPQLDSLLLPFHLHWLCLPRTTHPKIWPPQGLCTGGSLYPDCPWPEGYMAQPALELCLSDIPLVRPPDLRDVTHACCDAPFLIYFSPRCFRPLTNWTFHLFILMSVCFSSPGRAPERQRCVSVLSRYGPAA